jgi:CheY-like chemotaxis protein
MFSGRWLAFLFTDDGRSLTNLVQAAIAIDVDLPEMSGLELCETLEASSCSLLFILITAHTYERTRNLNAIPLDGCRVERS